MRYAALSSILLLAAVPGCKPRAQPVHGVAMGTFIADDAIRSVEVCKTTEAELLARFGPPAGQGSDGTFTTLHWSGAAVVADDRQGVASMQIIYVWIADAKVAGMVVNPAGMPTPPSAPCPADDAA